MLCIPIWIPHEILSMLSLNAWSKNETLPPTICYKKNSGAFGAKLGPNVLNILTILRWGRGGMSRAAVGRPPCKVDLLLCLYGQSPLASSGVPQGQGLRPGYCCTESEVRCHL